MSLYDDEPMTEGEQVTEIASMLVRNLKMNLYGTKAALGALGAECPLQHEALAAVDLFLQVLDDELPALRGSTALTCSVRRARAGLNWRAPADDLD